MKTINEMKNEFINYLYDNTILNGNSCIDIADEAFDIVIEGLEDGGSRNLLALFALQEAFPELPELCLCSGLTSAIEIIRNKIKE